MIIMLILTLVTIMIQVAALILATINIRKTPNSAWHFVAFTLLFLIARSTVSLFGLQADSVLSAVIGLVIGVFMFLSVVFISFLSGFYEQYYQHFKSMQNIDRVMLTGLSQNSVIQAIKESLAETIRSDAAGLYMIDKYKGILKVISYYNLDADFHNRITSADAEMLNMLLGSKNQFVLHSDQTSNVGFAQLMKEKMFSTCLFSPIIVRGVRVGLLVLCSSKMRSFTKRESEFIKSMSYQMAIAWEKWQIINRIAEMNFESVLALVQAIEMRDPYTKGHSLQVANLSVEIARKMALSDRHVELIQYAGLLHDVGKIAVPEAVLKKPSKLDANEWIIMKKHPVYSAKTIEPIKDLQEIYNWVLYHHERWDGAGYPEGIKGDQIPLEARILAVSDAYSAMIGNRPYRKGLAVDNARMEIRNYAAIQFDPGVVKAFLSLDGNALKILMRGEGKMESGTA